MQIMWTKGKLFSKRSAGLQSLSDDISPGKIRHSPICMDTYGIFLLMPQFIAAPFLLCNSFLHSSDKAQRVAITQCVAPARNGM